MGILFWIMQAILIYLVGCAVAQIVKEAMVPPKKREYTYMNVDDQIVDYTAFTDEELREMFSWYLRTSKGNDDIKKDILVHYYTHFDEWS